MAYLQRTARLIRGNGLIDRLRRVAPKGAGAPASQVLRTPRLSVVVPVYNVRQYLPEALGSLSDQSYANLEIIIVDDGSTDDSGAIADEFAAHEPRARVIHQENQGLGAARNTGIAAATGHYLTFFDSDDVVEPDAYETMIASLEATGSDFAVAPYRLLRNGKVLDPGRWIRDAHHTERRAITIDHFPTILANVVAWSKVYRRDFFLTFVGGYPTNVAWEDQEPAALSYARARKFDIVTKPIVRWRTRDEGTSITQQSGSVANLQARFATVNRALDIYRTAGHAAAHDERVLQVLANGTFTLGRIFDGDDAYWSVLRDGLRPLLEGARREDLIRRVNVQDRVLYHLVQNDMREAAMSFISAGGVRYTEWVVDVDGDGMTYGTVPDWDFDQSTLPAWVRRVTASQMTPQSFLDRWGWTDDGDLEISGYAYLAGLDVESELTATLLNATHGVEATAEVERASSTTAPSLTKHTRLDYASSGFRLRFRAADLAAARHKTGTQSLTFSLLIRLKTEGLVAHFTPKSTWMAVDHPYGPDLEEAGADVTTVTFSYARGLEVRTAAPEAVRAAGVHVHGRTVSLRQLSEVVTTDVHTAHKAGRQAVSARVTGDELICEVPEPADYIRSATRLRVSTTRGRHRLVISSTAATSADDSAELVVVRGALGEPYFYERAHNAFVEGIEVSDHTINVDLSFRPGADVSVRLAGARLTLEAPAEELRPGVYRAAVPFTVAEQDADWRTILAPQGSYTLQVHDSARAESPPVRVHVGEVLAGQLPLVDLGERHLRVTVREGRQRALRLSVSTAGPASDRTPRLMRLRTNAYRSATPPVERSVYLQCLAGDQVGDHQLALARVLRSEHPDIRIVWGVQSRSVRVPRQDDYVIIGTAAYFEALATTGVICVNHELAPFIKRRPGQLIVQTYHGHPFKFMGMARWRHLGSTAAQVERGLAWREPWDVLVSPSPIATQLYQENFPVPAEIIEIGSPRNDRLCTTTVDERDEIRSALGIQPGQTAVLYAPTWRDYATTNPWASKMVTFVDPSWLASQLGDDYVVLLRGHPAHGRGAYTTASAPGVIDVTYHPDVTDLIVASDVGVFDYSSIRFDYALTRNPMVFFTPDEREFFSAAPSLLPFQRTTPGPRVSTSDELVSSLKAIERRDVSGPYDEFIAQFLPWDDGRAARRLASAILERATFSRPSGRGAGS